LANKHDKNTMHPFKAYITLFSELSEEDWQKILPCLSYKVFAQNRMLLKPGNTCKNLYFLESGKVRRFQLIDQVEVTLEEIAPPHIFTVVESFTTQEVSEFGLQAMEESRLWVIRREDAYVLLDIPSWKNFLANL